MAIGLVSLPLEALSFHFLTTRKNGLYLVNWSLFLQDKQEQEQTSPNDALAVLVGPIQIWWFSDDETERFSSVKRSFAGQERQPQLDALGGGVLGDGEDRSWRKKLKNKLKKIGKKVAPIAGQLASTALKASGVPGAAQAGNMLDAGLAHGRALDEQDRQPLTESFMSGEDRQPLKVPLKKIQEIRRNGWNGWMKRPSNKQESTDSKIQNFNVTNYIYKKPKKIIYTEIHKNGLQNIVMKNLGRSRQNC